MNWFKRHLNWTMLLPTMGTARAFWALCAVFLAYPCNIHIGPLEGGLGLVWLSIGIPCGFVDAWGLKRKGRSLKWLLLIIPFGLLPYICLKNKATETETYGF